jgi:hypothetical protein
MSSGSALKPYSIQTARDDCTTHAALLPNPCSIAWDTGSVPPRRVRRAAAAERARIPRGHPKPRNVSYPRTTHAPPSPKATVTCCLVNRLSQVGARNCHPVLSIWRSVPAGYRTLCRDRDLTSMIGPEKLRRPLRRTHRSFACKSMQRCEAVRRQCSCQRRHRCKSILHQKTPEEHRPSSGASRTLQCFDEFFAKFGAERRIILSSGSISKRQ